MAWRCSKCGKVIYDWSESTIYDCIRGTRHSLWTRFETPEEKQAKLLKKQNELIEEQNRLLARQASRQEEYSAATNIPTSTKKYDYSSEERMKDYEIKREKDISFAKNELGIEKPVNIKEKDLEDYYHWVGCFVGYMMYNFALFPTAWKAYRDTKQSPFAYSLFVSGLAKLSNGSVDTCWLKRIGDKYLHATVELRNHTNDLKKVFIEAFKKTKGFEEIKEGLKNFDSTDFQCERKVREFLQKTAPTIYPKECFDFLDKEMVKIDGKKEYKKLILKRSKPLRLAAVFFILLSFIFAIMWLLCFFDVFEGPGKFFLFAIISFFIGGTCGAITTM